MYRNSIHIIVVVLSTNDVLVYNDSITTTDIIIPTTIVRVLARRHGRHADMKRL